MIAVRSLAAPEPSGVVDLLHGREDGQVRVFGTSVCQSGDDARRDQHLDCHGRVRLPLHARDSVGGVRPGRERQYLVLREEFTRGLTRMRPSDPEACHQGRPQGREVHILLVTAGPLRRIP